MVKQMKVNEECLTDQIKDAIFDYFYILDVNISKITFRVFNVATQGDKYVPAIKKLICAPNHDYKTALGLATELKLQDYIAWTEVVIPAILLSVPKECYEDFLEGNKKKSEEFVRWLDYLYDEYKC